MTPSHAAGSAELGDSGKPSDQNGRASNGGREQEATSATGAPSRQRPPAGWPVWEPPVIGRRTSVHPLLPDRVMRSDAVDLQVLLTAIGEAVREVDLRRLKTLPPETVSAQGAARWALYGYLDDVWSELKAAGLDGVDPLTRQSLAGLRDIASTLCSDTDHFKFRR